MDGKRSLEVHLSDKMAEEADLTLNLVGSIIYITNLNIIEVKKEKSMLILSTWFKVQFSI
jgi:hypothetical protein